MASDEFSQALISKWQDLKSKRFVANFHLSPHAFAIAPGNHAEGA